MNLNDETLLDNERVLVRRIVVEPGKPVVLPDCSEAELLVVIKGGQLTSRGGRHTLWPAGRMVWLPGSQLSPAGRVNEGPSPLEFVHVALKPTAPPGASGHAQSFEDMSLNYPNIPGEDVFENPWVIVQRFKVEAGQWEGVHAHVPNMLYIHVTGGAGPPDRSRKASMRMRNRQRMARSGGCPPSI